MMHFMRPFASLRVAEKGLRVAGKEVQDDACSNRKASRKRITLQENAVTRPTWLIMGKALYRMKIQSESGH